MFLRRCLHGCIIGSGPSGLYTSQNLLKKLNDIKLDIFERNSIPFGLLRYGVAPDHQTVKNAINSLEKVLADIRVRLFCNVSVGKDVYLSELLDFYDFILLAYGCSEHKTLNIPGNSLNGVFYAKQLIDFYNGFKEQHLMDLGEKVTIIGNGNVSLDICRLLFSNTNTLQKTDINDNFIKFLNGQNVKEVNIVARRGPLQASFSIKEFRELTTMEDVSIQFDEEIFENIEFEKLERQKKRLIELMKSTHDNSKKNNNKSKCLKFRFWMEPVEFSSGNSVNLSQIKFKNKLTSVGQEEIIDCESAIISIGFNGVCIDHLIPFNDKLSIINHCDGRIGHWLDSTFKPIERLYCSGWIKNGPNGNIVHSLNDSLLTSQSIMEDLNMLNNIHKINQPYSITDYLRSKNISYFDYHDWTLINNFELENGLKSGKCRQKIIHQDMLFKICNK